MNKLSDETAPALCHCYRGALWPEDCKRCNPPIVIITEVKAKAELEGKEWAKVYK